MEVNIYYVHLCRTSEVEECPFCNDTCMEKKLQAMQRNRLLSRPKTWQHFSTITAKHTFSRNFVGRHVRHILIMYE